MTMMQLGVVAAATLTLACGGTHEARVSNAAQLEIEGLATKLETDQIERVEIFQISPRVLTPVRMTPQMLETQFDYKLTIGDIRGKPHQGKLAESLRSSVVVPRGDDTDLRWGLVFYAPPKIVLAPETPDMNGARVAGLYFDASGDRGAVNGTPVTFQGSLFSWLNATFSQAFQQKEP